MSSPQHQLTGLMQYYTSVIDAWRTLSFTRPPDPTPGMWLFEEPLFNNGFLVDSVLTSTATSTTVRNKFREAGIVKLGHLTRTSLERLAEVTGIRSTRVLQSLVDEVWQSLAQPLRTFDQSQCQADQWTKTKDYSFPILNKSPAVGEWREESGRLLTLRTPALGTFNTSGGKQLCEGPEPPLSCRSQGVEMDWVFWLRPFPEWQLAGPV